MKQWQELAARFDARPRRERGMVTAAVLFGGAMLGYSLLIDPPLMRQASMEKRYSQATTSLTASTTQMVTTRALLKDPDSGNRTAWQQAQAAIAALDGQLRAMESSMVPPEKMQPFLESLLSANRRLELLSLRTLPPAPLIERKAEDKTTAGAPNIYKHGIEIRIAGSYNDLLGYLTQLESGAGRIFWNHVVLSVEQHPRCVLTLTFYTMSLDKQWLVL